MDNQLFLIAGGGIDSPRPSSDSSICTRAVPSSVPVGLVRRKGFRQEPRVYGHEMSEGMRQSIRERPISTLLRPEDAAAHNNPKNGSFVHKASAYGANPMNRR
jgi:hypothetical protein